MPVCPEQSEKDGNQLPNSLAVPGEAPDTEVEQSSGTFLPQHTPQGAEPSTD